MPSEAELRFRCGEIAEETFPDAVRIYRDLLRTANQVLIRLQGQQTRGYADHAAVTMLHHSHDAALCGLNLLCEGYPRLALQTARILREGHIAFRWAFINREAAATCFSEYRQRVAWPRGTWPSVGEMTLSTRGMTESPSYQQFHDLYRKTHNELFSHAISDFAIESSLGEFSGGGWTPRIGPVFERDLAEMAFSHFMPLVTWHLADCADFVNDLLGSRALDAAIEQVTSASLEWTASCTDHTRW
jgi:hypothetical protein